MPLEHIKVVNVGGFGARLTALLNKEVEAASLLPPQIAMADQLGLRKVKENTFHTIWWVPEHLDPATLAAVLRALARAERAIDADLGKYLPLWKHAIPAEFADHKWDFSQFGRGERFVYEKLPDGEFDEIMAQVTRWGLDNYLKERRFEHLAVSSR